MTESTENKATGNKNTPLVKIGLWVLFVVIVIIALMSYWHHEKMYPSTDDAYVQAHTVQVAAQVTGPVSKIYVQNNQQVHQGQALFDVDPKPFQIAVASAKATLDQAKQKVASAGQAVNSAQANVAERASQLSIANKTTTRTLILASRGEVSKEMADKARSDVEVAHAALNAAQSQLKEAQAELGKLGNQNADIRQATASLAEASLNLKHTHVTAPSNGKLVNFDLRVGSMIQQDQDLFNLVNENVWWVNANFKETQLDRIKAGQAASITLDMYGSHTFQGTVESLSSGSGAAFSMLPPENATGNWVKVTQRFPVKVLIKNLSANYPLRVGASASVTVDTKS